jgi:hypothetical protein
VEHGDDWVPRRAPIVNYLQHDACGGWGVNGRAANVLSTGKSGKWVYCQSGTNERIYFVEPPRGWGPETAYNIG